MGSVLAAVADDNVVAVLTAPGDARVRETAGLARQTRRAALRNQQLAGAVLAGNVRRNHHLQRRRLWAADSSLGERVCVLKSHAHRKKKAKISVVLFLPMP